MCPLAIYVIEVYFCGYLNDLTFLRNEEHNLTTWHCIFILPPAQRVCWGYIGFTPSVCPSFRPSVRPAYRVRSVAPTVLVGPISYLYILSSNFRMCVACKVSYSISKFELRGNF